MNDDWNKEGFFSGITEDYSNYRWYKGENKNPYQEDQERPLARRFWEYERDFHFGYLDSRPNVTLKEAYLDWKKGFIEDYLPGKSANPYGDNTDWNLSFDTGVRCHKSIYKNIF